MNSRSTHTSYGFTSMGWPEASLAELASLAREFNLDFIEVRALQGTIELPDYFASNPLEENPPSIHPPVRMVATNLGLAEATDEDIAHFLRFVDIAILLRAPYVRVFGGYHWGNPLSPSQWEQAVRTVKHCRAEIGKKSAPCEILLETHTAFSSSAMCLKLNEMLDEPLHLLWDSHHTWRTAGETPAESWQRIGHLVRHMHVSDSQLRTAPKTGYDCVLPGAGDYPFEELRKLLDEVCYPYGVSLEWERIWHPELPDVRIALKEFQRLLVGDRAAINGKL